jgi:hypothetical protein
MIYDKEDYQKEYDLVKYRIKKTGAERKYPEKYIKLANEAVDKMFNIFNTEPNQELLNHPLVLKAFELAEKCHSEQERKYTREPYFVHLREVASIISSLEGSTHHEVAAAILHDVVEKGNISFEYVKEHFGDIVHNHVYFLSDESFEGLNRKDRLLANFEKFIKSPANTQAIKMADVLSNTRSTVLCDARYGKTYMEPVFEYMNPYFQNAKGVPKKLKDMFQTMCDISEDLIKHQEKLGIHKIEKNWANAKKSEKKKAKVTDKVLEIRNSSESAKNHDSKLIV